MERGERLSAVTLTRADARRLLVAHHGLGRRVGRGASGVRAVLERLRCIQLDPLDAIGTNADLVVMARVKDARRGDVWRHLFPRHAFEHFAKERCILPADAFPWYRAAGHSAQTPWWRHGEREKRVSARMVLSVLEEIRTHGPVVAADLTDHGRVVPMDWSGWKSTSKATSMALDILWTQCEIVVAGRTDGGAKIYDVPERSLHWDGSLQPAGEFARWALRERARAAGLLTRAAGSMWSMLSSVRQSPLIEEMVADGELIEVLLEDSNRRYLAVPELLRAKARSDDEVRILGPLDPLLWDRDLIRHVFEFDYVWEVYKPAPQRKWGWYVCPLLHRDQFVGRVDAHLAGGALVVKKLWVEHDDVDRDAIHAALEVHAERCGATRVKMPRGRR